MDTKGIQGLNDANQTGSFNAELGAVHAEMLESLSDLSDPFSALIESRIRNAGVPLHAALVLASGYDSSDPDPRARIHLAAALEMLHVALGIHQLLLESSSVDTDGQPERDQRSFIGSTILAGDFCFSRSAQMAARTDNPTIVAIFAEALQDVSESLLRRLLSEKDGQSAGDDSSYFETLMRYGARAAHELSDLPPKIRPTLQELAEGSIRISLAPSMPRQDTTPSPDDWPGLVESLPAAHRARWEAYRSWLDASG